MVSYLRADVASGRAGAPTRGTWDYPVGATRRWGHVAEPRVARAWLSGAQGVRQRGKWPRDPKLHVGRHVYWI